MRCILVLLVMINKAKLFTFRRAGGLSWEEYKVKLVTGGALGIGLSISPLMAKESAKVVIADFNEAGAKEAAGNIKKQGGEAAGVFLDAGQADSIQAAALQELK